MCQKQLRRIPYINVFLEVKQLGERLRKLKLCNQYVCPLHIEFFPVQTTAIYAGKMTPYQQNAPCIGIATTDTRTQFRWEEAWGMYTPSVSDGVLSSAKQHAYPLELSRRL